MGVLIRFVRFCLRLLVRFVRYFVEWIVAAFAVAVALNLAFPQTELHYLIHDTLRITSVGWQVSLAVTAVFAGFYVHLWLKHLLRLLS